MNLKKLIEKMVVEAVEEATAELLEEQAIAEVANPVYPIVKEVRTIENPDLIVEMLNSGNWVALNGINDRGVLKLMLGRVNPVQAGQEEP